MATATGERRLATTPRNVAARLTALALVAALVGCSSDDDALPTEPPVQPRDTTTTIVATTVPATAVTPASAASTSTEMSTTAGPPTSSVVSAPVTATPTSPALTVAPSDEEAVRLLVDNTYRVWRECLRVIEECDTSAFGEYSVDPMLSDRTSRVEEWRADNIEVVNVDSYTFEILEIHLDFTIPYVLVCERDGAALVLRPPGEPEQIVDQSYFERVRELQLRRIGTQWKAEGFATREEVEGQVGALCS